MVGFSLAGWLFDIGRKVLVNRASKLFAPNPLITSINREADEWAKTDAREVVVERDAESLLAEFFGTSLVETPLRDDVQRLIEHKRAPTAEEWLAALSERWAHLHAAPSESVRPFFQISPEAAEAVLKPLAKRLAAACLRTDAQIGMTALFERVDEIHTIVGEDHEERYSLDRTRTAFADFSQPLLTWPTRLATGDSLDRPELATLTTRIDTEETSTTVVLGERGSGKSVLLAKLGQLALEKGWTIFAIKADRLTEENESEVEHALGARARLADLLRETAARGKTLLLVDQLDAVAEIADRSARRMNFLLNLIQRTSNIENLHVVVSSRTFEFETDTRLRSIHAERLDLQLPPWEHIAPIISRAHHRAEAFSDALRELLRNPWALNIYLTVAEPEQEFASLTELLEALWQSSVVAAPDANERAELLNELVESMTRLEELSLPASAADRHPGAVAGLRAANILMQEGVRLSLRHQTFYEFILARQLARDDAALVAHVLEHQDGVFVRPAIIATLAYMRECGTSVYLRVVGALLSRDDIRLHIRALVVDFLASQQRPAHGEIAHVLRLLREPLFIGRILLAAASSVEWFRIVRDEVAFAELLADPAHAYKALGMLASAVRIDRATVLELVERYWIRDSRFHNLATQVILADDRFDGRALALAKAIVSREESDWLLENAAKVAPLAAIRLLRTDLQRRMPPTALSRETDYAARRDIEHALNASHSEVSDDLAASEPSAFLSELWPWFARVADAVADPAVATTYRRILFLDFDVSLMRAPTIVDSLMAAAHAFAERSPDTFIDFMQLRSGVDVSVLHLILVAGLEVIAQDRPDVVLSYLLGDRRRLALGSSDDSWTEATAHLIGLAYGAGREDLQRAIDRMIFDLDVYADSTPRDEEHAQKQAAWNREHRLALLEAIPIASRTADVTAAIGELRREFPKRAERRPSISGGFVGPRVTAEELRQQTDDDWLRLFNEITDSDEGSFHQPDLEITRAGGVGVQARAVTEALQHDAPRGIALLGRLDPGRHQRYAAAIVEAIAISFSPEDLFGLLSDLDARGFGSEEFRVTAAGAFERIATTSGGLSDECVALLERWLDEYPRSPDDVTHDRGDAPEPIVFNRWGGGFHYGIPHRLQIASALARGLLKRTPPAIDRWLSALRAEISRERGAIFWTQAITNSVSAINEAPEATNELLGELFREQPMLLRDRGVLFLLGRFMPRLEPQHVQVWMESIREAAEFYVRQAFGEIIALANLWHADDWTNTEIERAIESRDGAVLTGVGFAAPHLWTSPRTRQIFRRVLATIAQLAPHCPSAALIQFMSEAANEPLDAETEEIVRAILRNGDAAAPVIESLVDLGEANAGTAPGLTADIAERVLDLVGRDLRGGRLEFRIAGALTGIALTLHRQNGFREKGLRLFERLMEFEIREADAALEILDRRPTRRLYGISARRRRSRSRRRRNQRRSDSGD